MYLFYFMNSYILNSSRSSSRSLLTEAAVYHSTSGPFYLIRTSKLAKTLDYYTEGNVKNTNKSGATNDCDERLELLFFALFFGLISHSMNFKAHRIFWWS